MNDSTQKYIDFLDRKIERQEGVIESLKRENDVHFLRNKELKKKYKIVKILLIIFIVIEFIIRIYHFI
jgi:hypothetical protein